MTDWSLYSEMKNDEQKVVRGNPRKETNFKPVHLPYLLTCLTTANGLCAAPCPRPRSMRKTAMCLGESWLLKALISAECGGTPKWLSIHEWLESIRLEPYVFFIYFFLAHRLSWVLHWALTDQREQGFFLTPLVYQPDFTVDRWFKSCTRGLQYNVDNSGMIQGHHRRKQLFKGLQVGVSRPHGMFILWDLTILQGLKCCFYSVEPGRRKNLEIFLTRLWQFFISLFFVHLYSWNLLLLLNFPENRWTEAPLFISLTSAIWPTRQFNPASTFEWIFSQVAISSGVTLRGNRTACYLAP